MPKIDIELPRVYRDIAVTESPRVAVEHASLNARALESLLALALRDATDSSRSIAIVNPDLERIRFCFADWFSRIGVRWRRIYSTGSAKGETQYQSYRLGESTIWLVGGRRIAFEDVPFTELDAVYVPRAHLVPRDVVELADPFLAPSARIVCAGEFEERDHWFYRFGRADGTSLVRLTSDMVCEAFPDQKARVLPRKDPRYDRQMALVDVPPRFEAVPFRTFARTRLKVRTDKKPEFLSPAQCDEAAMQLGPDWASGMVGTPTVTFELTQQQRLYLALKRLAVAQGRKPWFLLLKSRRGGYTTLEQAQSYRVCATQRSSRVATLADTDDKTRSIFEIAKTFHASDPKAPRLDGDAEDYIAFADTRSRFFIGTAGGRAFGRGDTLTRAHGSEVAWWNPGPKQAAKTDALVAGLTGACDNGEVVLETTPNGREWFCLSYEEAKAGKNLYTPIFLPWFTDPGNRVAQGRFNPEEIRDTLTDDERALMEPRAVSLGGVITRTYRLDLAQIAFRRAKQKQYRHLFQQEYPEDDVSCFLTSGLSFFTPDRVLELLRTVEEPGEKRRHVPGGYEIRWEEPREGRSYVIGADSSEGIPGGDFGVIVVLDKESGAQVAVVRGHFRPHVLAGHAIRLSEEYNGALTGVERQHPGPAVLQEIERLGHGKPHFRGGRLYFHAKPANTWRSMDDRERASRAGWSTNENTRPVMLDELARALDDRAMEVRSRNFLAECVTFRMQSNGKFAADSGAHDDEVMAWAIAWQLRKYRRPMPRVTEIEVGF